jgi:uncharacterized protein (TIGR04255 family)
VIEVVFGVQFPTIEPLSAAHIGAFWQGMRSEYPMVEDKAPLPAIYEPTSKGDAARSKGALEELVEVAVLPLRRSFFISSDGTWLAQVQGNRVLHNWRKQAEKDEYPRYEKCLERFQSVWRGYREFLDRERLPVPVADQLELTYVNHIPYPSAMNSLADISAVFPDITWQPNRLILPAPSALRWRLDFDLPNNTGRLHVDVKTGVRTKDKLPLLVCELTARGLPEGSDDQALASWFDQGRQWIVKGFADLTGQDVQRDLWQRRT